MALQLLINGKFARKQQRTLFFERSAAARDAVPLRKETVRNTLQNAHGGKELISQLSRNQNNSARIISDPTGGKTSYAQNHPETPTAYFKS